MAGPADEPPNDDSLIDPKVVDATLQTYYPAVIGSADTARARAQTAYTIASATAAALVAAGALADISAYPTSVQVLGGLSLIGWLLAAALFMYVSVDVNAGPIAILKRKRRAHRQADKDSLVPKIDYLDAGPFVSEALTEATDARTAVDGRLNRAIGAVWASLLLTAVTLFLAVALGKSAVVRDNVVVDLTPAGQKVVTQLCGTDPPTVQADLDVKSLQDDFVDMKVHDCGGQTRTLVVPRDSVNGVEQPRGKFPFVRNK